MTTIEDRLRDLGRAVDTPSLPGAGAVMHRRRRRRRRRRGGLAAVLVVAGAGGAIGANALRPDGRTTVLVESADDGADAGPASTPSTTSMTTSATTGPDASSQLSVPDVTGLSVAQADQVLEDLGFMVQIVGDGSEDASVHAQQPAPGVTAPVGSTIRLEVA
jgi:hypothetical protein